MTGLIKGIIFDYGGTIDSNGVHWAEVIWKAYQKEQAPVEKTIFREAYVYAERLLGKNPIIQPHHTFSDMMQLKINIQFKWLIENKYLIKSAILEQQQQNIAEACYEYAKQSVQNAIPILEKLAAKFPLVLVSNFYGNISSVLHDFQLDSFFPTIIESAVVGIRKPDPRIFSLGVDALNIEPDKVVVIGDSYDKDIVPARSIGCKTIWLKGLGWEEYRGDEIADVVIEDFGALKKVFRI